MDRYNISHTGEKTPWDENRFNPYYEDVNDWYTVKSINGNVSSVYINDVRHDKLTFVSDY